LTMLCTVARANRPAFKLPESSLAFSQQIMAKISSRQLPRAVNNKPVAHADLARLVWAATLAANRVKLRIQH
jgi:hypothetical protein